MVKTFQLTKSFDIKKNGKNIGVVEMTLNIKYKPIKNKLNERGKLVLGYFH